ncbi:hypothetical protein ACSBR1_008998 [Camellia fascicularis]
MEPINKVVNLECKGMIHSMRVCEEQVVLAKMTKMVCQCQKNQELEELGSSNTIDEHGIERGNSAEDRDGDLESDSDHALALLDDVAIDMKALGGRKSEEVEQEVCCKSDTVVVESRSGAGMLLGMRNHNIGLSAGAKACRLMMGMEKHNVGSAVGNKKSQSMDAHASSIKEGTGETGLAVQSSSVSKDKEMEPNSRPVNSKKGKKKVSYKIKMGINYLRRVHLVYSERMVKEGPQQVDQSQRMQFGEQQ